MRMPFLIIFSLSLLAACNKADVPDTTNHAELAFLLLMQMWLS